jgi:hypothetical protein
MRAKRERLEAWKREREAKKSLGDAKAKAMALAGKRAPTPPSKFTLYLFYRMDFTPLDLDQQPQNIPRRLSPSSTGLLSAVFRSKD